MLLSIDGIVYSLTEYGIERMDNPEPSAVPAYV